MQKYSRYCDSIDFYNAGHYCDNIDLGSKIIAKAFKRNTKIFQQKENIMMMMTITLVNAKTNMIVIVQ